MSDWQPSCGVDTARLRAFLLSRARRYFGEHGVLEVDTPAIGEATATDPNIDSYVVDGAGYLQTSPESCMKRLLAAGYPDIYSICRVFRRGEAGRRHLPEFTLVEWYRLGFELADIIADTLGFIATVLDRHSLATTATLQPLDFDAGVNNQSDAIEDIIVDTNDSGRDVFLQTLSIDPFVADIETLAEAAGADADLRHALGDRRDAWLDLLFSTQIAEAFDERGLTVVCRFPASQAALARLSHGDPRVSDRFEVFLGDLELANGFVELTDAVEQALRMENDIETRRKLGRDEVPRDDHLIAALDAGLPPCAGVAVGFERLHMIAAHSDDIRSVVTFD